MSGGIAIGWFSPHPPIIIPAVGRGEEAQAADTCAAMNEAAALVANAHPDAIIIFGPHGPVFADAFTIAAPGRLQGSFAPFGAPKERVSVTIAADLTTAIMQRAEGADLPLYGLTLQLKQRLRLSPELDHGLLVPLWYLQQAYGDRPLPPMVMINIAGLPLLQHYRLGSIIQEAVAEGDRRVAIIGSGDLSHSLSKDAPAGYHPQAHRFDQGVAELFSSQAVLGLLRLEELAPSAAECGFRPLVLFLGCFDGLAGRGQVLSYQAPFGVGYLVGVRHVAPGSGASWLDELILSRQRQLQEQRHWESAPVRLARSAVEQYVKAGELLATDLSQWPADLPAKAGVFVSIKKHSQLRGCIGTIEPTASTLQEEIIQNARSAAGEDPRFPPITADELPELSYSVDVLGEIEPVKDVSDLDPVTYGVIVSARGRQGLLLPDLPGVNSAKEQVAIAKQKAGLRPDEEVQLSRFAVTRWH
jgi:AmmeMemoRadiSam system protein A/AmmeMemoRadiSam system protein B